MRNDVEELVEIGYRRYYEYYSRVKVLLALKEEFVKHRDMDAFIEPTVRYTGLFGEGERRPDLLVIGRSGDRWAAAALDHKHFKSKRQFPRHVERVRRYRGIGHLAEGGPGEFSVLDVGIVCPRESWLLVREDWREPPIPLIVYRIEGFKISLRTLPPRNYKPRTPPMRWLLRSEERVVKMSSRAIYFRFLRERPPIEYAAVTVYEALVFLGLNPLEKEIQVEYREALDYINRLYPPWVAPGGKIRQVSEGTFRRAIKVLQEIKLVRLKYGVITVKRPTYGARNIVEYVMKKLAKARLIKKTNTTMLEFTE